MRSFLLFVDVSLQLGSIIKSNAYSWVRNENEESFISNLVLDANNIRSDHRSRRSCRGS
jgi:hypothetical protein